MHADCNTSLQGREEGTTVAEVVIDYEYVMGRWAKRYFTVGGHQRLCILWYLERLKLKLLLEKNWDINI